MINIKTDWFNPVLLKELRQDFRSNRIQRATAILLVLACLFTFMGVFSSSLVMVMILMVFIVPGRLTRSLSAGEPDNCLELLSLTRLSSFRVVLGKWLAGIAASAFYYLAAVPFAAAYFVIEKQNLYQSLNVVLLLGLASIAACSFAIALGSVADSKGISTGYWVVGIFLFFSFIGPLVGYGASGLTSGIVLGVADFVVLFIYLMFAVSICLLSGAASISGGYENYNPAKRVMSFLVVVVTALLLIVSFGTIEITIVSSCVIVVAACFFAVFEKRLPFVKKVSSIAPLNWILSGGELQGLIWAFFLTLSHSLIISFSDSSFDTLQFIGAGIILFLAIAFPRAIQLRLPDKMRNKFMAYLIIQLILVILSIAIGTNFWSYRSDVSALTGISPLMMFLYASLDGKNLPGGYYVLGLAQLVLTFTLVASRKESRN